MLSLSTYIKHPSKIFLGLLSHTAGFWPDKLYLKWRFRLEMGKKLNLKNPQTFSEKIQWLKLYDRKPEYTIMVDKHAVKKYVADKIGEEYIIPTLGVWSTPEEIEWDKLPDQFVLKTTHGGGGGGVVICKDKTTLDKNRAIAKLNMSLESDIYRNFREWPYKSVPKRIIAEKLLVDNGNSSSDLPDYKFFCFNGICKYCQVIKGRDSIMTIDFFDKDWKHQPFHEPENYPFAEDEINKPFNIELMWTLAETLAANKAFSRIDFYEVNNKVYLGEITFYPTSGFGGFSPKEWDEKIGSLIKIPLSNR